MKNSFLFIPLLVGMNFLCATHVTRSHFETNQNINTNQNNYRHKYYLDSVSDALSSCLGIKLKSELDTNLNNEIEFTIKRNGNIANSKIRKSSGLPLFDSITLNCVKELKCNPLPVKFKEDSINFLIHYKNNGQKQ